MVDENRANAVRGRGETARLGDQVAERNRQRLRWRTRDDAAVSRHHDVDVMSELHERTRQGANDVRQSAGLGEGNRLRGDHQNPHPAQPYRTNMEPEYEPRTEHLEA